MVPDIEHIVSSIAKAIQAGDETKDGETSRTEQASNAAKVEKAGLGPRDLHDQPSVQKR